MRVRITHVSLWQTAKVVSAMYFIAAIVGTILLSLLSLFSNGAKQPYALVLVVIAPFFYALVGFVFTFLGAWVYNQVARIIGGIEYTTTEVRDI